MKRIIPLALVVVGLLLVAGTLAWSYSGGPGKPAEMLLPDSIAGLQITDYKSGEQAIAEFENLHGKQFPVTSGAIGVYGDRQITLWAAGADSESIAAQMVDAMQEKIAEGNSPFTPLSEVNDNNRTVYALEGMGQKHYYFQSENLVIWLAADPAIADAAIQQTLEVYP